MTEQEKWANYNKWRDKEEYRKELRKTHPDLAELYGMRNGLYYHIQGLQDTLDEYETFDSIYHESSEDIEEVKGDIEFFEKIYKHIAKECDELFEKYGVKEHEA